MRFEQRKSKDDIDELEFLEVSYSGGRGYINLNISKHERESEANFKRRKKAAFFVNYNAPVIDLYNQYLFREEVTRDYAGIDGASLDVYLKDADKMGRSHSQFIRMMSKMASVVQYVGVVVDKPKGESASKADELAQDIRPYVSLYEPDSILDWKMSKLSGRNVLEEIVLEEDDDFIRVWTADDWKLYKQEKGSDAVLHDVGANALGMVPFVLHRNRDALEPDMFSGMSDIESIAYVSRAIFALDVNAESLISDTAFAMLSGPEDTKSETQDGGDITVGTGSYLGRRPGDPDFKWVEPPHGSLKAILDWRNMYVMTINQLAKTSVSDASQKGSVKSGVALEIEFQDLNAILSEKAEQCEKTENAIFELFAAWENLTFTGNVEYARKFGIRDLGNDLDTAIKALTVVTSSTFKNEQAKQVAKRVLRNPEQSIMDAIESELSQPNTLDLLNVNQNQGS